MPNPRLFITQPVEKSALKRLQAVMEVEVNPDASRSIRREKLIEGVRRSDYLFCRLGDIVDGEVMDANPGLQLIATMASSPAQVDLMAATLRKIPVVGRKPQPGGAPADSIAEETADMTWALLLAAARRIVEGDRLARAGIFPGPQSMHLLGAQVHGKTIGIVGLGKIGQAVARRALGFGMRVLYYSRRRHPDVESRLAVVYTALEPLMKTADFITLHPAYTPETHHLIGARELAWMKPGAFLINTSRGPVVDQAALFQALCSDKIAGAALDVFEDEPYPALPAEIVALPNVVLTPHLGSAVAEKREIMANAVADIILAFLAGKGSPYLFNPQIYD